MRGDSYRDPTLEEYETLMQTLQDYRRQTWSPGAPLIIAFRREAGLRRCQLLAQPPMEEWEASVVQDQRSEEHQSLMQFRAAG